VAIKFLPAGFGGRPEAFARFKSESNAAAAGVLELQQSPRRLLVDA